MSPREKSFWWKVGYVVAIAVLLAFLFWLGAPATNDAQNPGGGKLARLREEHNLSQRLLGDLNASSETVKLATLGLRGVAANILWGKAHVYKKKKDWTNLEACVNQITALQPNFIEIWKFQGWNLAYNVSAEFDGYRDRYAYVIKGANFLRRGFEYNDREPRLLWEIGWIISQKIGRADESKQFRRLFKEDDDYFRTLPFDVLGPDPRDNWLVGKGWFREATELVDTKGVPMKGKDPLLYRSSGPMCQMNYAETLENNGRFGSIAQEAWKAAANEWYGYGDVELPWMLPSDNSQVMIRLNDLDRGRNYLAQIEQIDQKIDAMEPGLRAKIGEEKRAKLSDEQREALDTPPFERLGVQVALANEAERLLVVTNQDLANRITDPASRAKAKRLLNDRTAAQEMADLIRRRREVVNFEYWRLRADVEQTAEAVAAHEWVYLGDQAMSAGRLEPAKRNFDQGLVAWRKLLDSVPEALSDQTFGEDLVSVIGRYRALLALRDEKEHRDATFGADQPRLTLGLEYVDSLDEGIVSPELVRAFSEQRVEFPDDATVRVDEPGNRWVIPAGAAEYIIAREGENLSVVEHFILSDVVQRYEQQKPEEQ